MADDLLDDLLIRGDVANLVLTLTTGTFLAGDRVRLTAKRSRRDDDADAVFVKTSASGQITFTPDGDTATAALVAADTAGLPGVRVRLYCDWQVTNASNEPRTPDRFQVDVVPDSSITVP